MLKIKDNVDLKKLERYGFRCGEYNRNLGIEWHLKPKRPFRSAKIWIDKNRILHFNSIGKTEMDLMYELHYLIELRGDKE